MMRVVTLALFVAVCACVSLAQASGNVGYAQGGGSAKAEINERQKRVPAQGDAPPNSTSMFVEASVLANVKADEYVAVFGVAQECATVPECNQKMDATTTAFISTLKGLGVGAEDVYVDFAAQNKIYGYQVSGTIAKENLVGFELKKNVSVHYRDKSLLDRLVVAASRAQIYDLIKVDYVVRDTAAVQNRLMEEAAAVIKRKAARYENLFAIKLLAPAQVYAEKPSIYFPVEMYDSYTAYESEEIDADAYRQKYTVQGARKSRTFFFNALDANGFDAVVNPVVIEPVVQFTLYLKVRYEIEQPKK
jgi:uncharacterized protein YggE